MNMILLWYVFVAMNEKSQELFKMFFSAVEYNDSLLSAIHCFFERQFLQMMGLPLIENKLLERLL